MADGQEALDVVPVRDSVYMIAGAGANVTVQFGSDGAIVVDAGALDKADTLVAAIKKITTQPIRYVIDTSADADHVGGNEKVAKAGRTLFQTNNPLGEGMTNGGAAAVLAAEKVLTRMSAPTGKASPYPTVTWPTETYDQRRKYMLPEPRRHRGSASAGRAQRRRQRRLLPPLRCRLGGRYPRPHPVSRDRCRPRRKH